MRWFLFKQGISCAFALYYLHLLAMTGQKFLPPSSPTPLIPLWLMTPHLYVFMYICDRCSDANTAVANDTPSWMCFLVYICLLSCTCWFSSFAASNHFECASVQYFCLIYYVFITAMTQEHAWFLNSCLYFLLIWAVSLPYLHILLFNIPVLHNTISWGFFFNLRPNFLAVIEHCFCTISLSFIFE